MCVCCPQHDTLPACVQDPWGSPAHGWDSQMEVMVRKYENVSLLDRIPQAMWRGRTQDKIYPHRDHLR